MKEINKFTVAKVKAEVLEEVFNDLQEKLNNCTKHWGRTDEMQQVTRWDSDTHGYVKVWEDEEQTVPKMEYVYDDIEYTEEELEDLPDVRAKKVAIQDIMKALDKLF